MPLTARALVSTEPSSCTLYASVIHHEYSSQKGHQITPKSQSQPISLITSLMRFLLSFPPACLSFIPILLYQKWTKTLSKGHFTALGSCIQESNVWSKASWGALFSYHHPTDDREWQITCQSQHTRQRASLPVVLSFLAPAKALWRMKEWFINSSRWSQSIVEAADQPGLYSGCSGWCLYGHVHAGVAHTACMDHVPELFPS